MTFENDAVYYVVKGLVVVLGALGMMASCTRIKCSRKKLAVVLALYLLWVGIFTFVVMRFFGILVLLRLCIPMISAPAIFMLYVLSEYSPWQAVFNYTMQLSVAVLFAMFQTILVTVLGGGRLIDFFIRLISYGICIYIEWKFIKKAFSQLDYIADRSWRNLTLIPIGFTVLIFLMGTYPVHFLEAEQNILYLSVLTVIMLTVYVILFHSLLDQYHLQLLELTAVSNDMLKKELALQQKQVEEAKRIRHDLRHHDLMIAEYARKGEIKELLECLKQHEQEYSEHVSQRICENIVVNNILEAYVKRARQIGIEVLLDVSVGQDTGIGETDFIAILGNAMDNAVSGCQKSGKAEKQIKVVIKQKAGKLAIQISNTCPERVVFQNGLPVRDLGRGIGTVSMVHSVQNYKGEVDFKVEKGEFVVRILMKLSETAWHG